MSGLWGKGDQEPGKKYSDRIYLSDWPPAFRVTFAKLELPWSRKISTAIDEREQKVYRKRLWPTPVNVRFGWMLTASKIVIHLSKNLQLQGKVFLVSFPPESNRHYGNIYSGVFFAITLSRIDYHSAHPFELQRRKITFWTRRVKSFHTCTAPSPPPARPFSERNIYCYFRHHRHCQYLKSSFNVLLLAFWIFVSIGFRVEQVDSTSRYAVLAAAGTTNSCYIAILSQQWHGMVDWNWHNKP